MRTFFALLALSLPLALIACDPTTESDTDAPDDSPFEGQIWRIEIDEAHPNRSVPGPWTPLGGSGHVCLVLDDDSVARVGWFYFDGGVLQRGAAELGLWREIEQDGDCSQRFDLAGDEVLVETWAAPCNRDEGIVMRWISSPRPSTDLPPDHKARMQLDATACEGAL